MRVLNRIVSLILGGYLAIGAGPASAQTVREASFKVLPTAACSPSCEGAWRRWRDAAESFERADELRKRAEAGLEHAGTVLASKERQVAEQRPYPKLLESALAERELARRRQDEARRTFDSAEGHVKKMSEAVDKAREAYWICCGIEEDSGPPLWPLYTSAAAGALTYVVLGRSDSGPEVGTPNSPPISTPTGAPPPPPSAPAPGPAPSPPVPPAGFTGSFIGTTVAHTDFGRSTLCTVYVTNPPQASASFVVDVTGPGVIGGQNLNGTLNANGQAAIRVEINAEGTYVITVSTRTPTAQHTAAELFNVSLAINGTCAAAR